ncbi:hypothetical protein [Leptolyngbya sp. FACHB-711]|uniref:hypothetical protein n=1 Tax=unclassified Leptolyngbya TaxID=2650499 RepID=UPI0016890F56|nr:hypothetical protein [Leptolyngbya sp. FACHB-711]MBD1851955.1 hypothetical protein [Cyanobacteria bacterium FACHB-502]MBD2027762.1 hypothetical protein [Leptolyngbya sp. FACHB-711]
MPQAVFTAITPIALLQSVPLLSAVHLSILPILEELSRLKPIGTVLSAILVMPTR